MTDTIDEQVEHAQPAVEETLRESPRAVTPSAQPGRPSAAATVRITAAKIDGGSASSRMSRKSPARAATRGSCPAAPPTSRTSG